MFFRSIRFRLTLWYTVTLAVVLVLFSCFLYLTFKGKLYDDVDSNLRAVAESLASPTLEPFLFAAPSAFDQVLEDFLGTAVGNKYVQVLDQAGRVISRSGNLQDTRLPLSRTDKKRVLQGRESVSTHLEMEPGGMRLLAYPIVRDGVLTGIVQVGASLTSATETLGTILLVLAISVPLSLCMLAYGGWFMAGRALKPVEVITRSAQKISAENLSQRLEVVNPSDEIGRLAETFNTTLARLEDAFNRAKQFSSDVSHELRTPLTILRGETEVALRWAKEPEEYRIMLQSNLEEIKRMSEIIEYLLDLSRAEEGRLRLNVNDLDVNELLTELVQQVGLLAKEKGVAMNYDSGPPVLVCGDWLRLRQLFLNLLDNAVTYTASGGSIRIQLETSEGSVRVVIADTGSGIPAEDLPHIFDRFYRVDKARNRADGGTGLGLSLAKSLAEAHGGRIEVSSLLHVGSTFTVVLPLQGWAAPPRNKETM